MATSLSRRQFLQRTGAVTGTLMVTSLAGCSDNTNGTGDSARLTGTPEPVDDSLTLARPAQGADRDAADVTVATFEDYTCPACGFFEQNIVPLFKQEYFGTDRVRLEFYDFPLPHSSLSRPAAAAGRAVQATQGVPAFYEFKRRVFDNQEGLEKTDLVDFGVAVGMNRSAFPTVVDEMEYLPVVDADRAYGADAGVHATPTVFVNGRALENPGWNYLQPAVDNALSN